MEEVVKEYKKEDLTVIWKPGTCIHSENCFKGLPMVFDPNKKPWVNVEGASKKEIMEQIDKCPSKALDYKLDNEEELEVDDEQIVEVSPNGPLLVYGNIKVKHPDGSEVSKSRVTAFCRCGASQNKPFCDGTHKKIEFKG